jgi:4'-phosphopantetheinyl transferase
VESVSYARQPSPREPEAGVRVDPMSETHASLDLWLVDLDDCAEALEEVERVQPRLAQDDIGRAGAILDLRERRHRLAVYTALRILLERVAGPSVRAAPVARKPGTKPRLEDCPADFSLSHTGGFALIGVSKAPPVGVDLEGPRTVQMVPHRMSEIIAIGSTLGEMPLPDESTDRGFLQAWARLEAFSKARGCGLALTLADLGARGLPRSRPPLSELRANAQRLVLETGLTVQDIALPSGLVGAVAAPRGTPPLRVRRFPAGRQAIEQLIG